MKKDNPSYENERKVLNELLKNSRQSNQDIGKKLGISRQTVYNIIKRLEKNNTIWGYTIAVDEKRVEYGMIPHYIALIKTKDITSMLKKTREMMIHPNVREAFLKKNKLEGIQFVFACVYHGCYDIMVGFQADSLMKAKRLLAAISKDNESIEKMDILQPIVILRQDGFKNPNLEEEYDEIL